MATLGFPIYFSIILCLTVKIRGDFTIITAVSKLKDMVDQLKDSVDSVNVRIDNLEKWSNSYNPDSTKKDNAMTETGDVEQTNERMIKALISEKVFVTKSLSVYEGQFKDFQKKITEQMNVINSKIEASHDTCERICAENVANLNSWNKSQENYLNRLEHTVNNATIEREALLFELQQSIDQVAANTSTKLESVKMKIYESLHTRTEQIWDYTCICPIPFDIDRRLSVKYELSSSSHVDVSEGDTIRNQDYAIFNCSNVIEQKYEPANRRFQCVRGQWMEADISHDWKLGNNGAFPECREAICDPPCENGGVCFRDGLCRCKHMTTRERCQTAAPGSPPRNVRARPHSLQTIFIDWEEPEIPNGGIQGYKVFYTTKPELPIVLWQSQEVTGDSKMATISGRIPNSTYTITVTAFSGIGQGPLSVPVQVMTRFGDTDTETFWSYSPPIYSNGGNFTDTMYQVTVAGYTRRSDGLRTRPKTISTKGAVPLQPRNLRAKPISPNEIEVIWDAPEDVDRVVRYSLYYNDSQNHQNVHVRFYPPVTRYMIPELVPDTTYHIQLAARSNLGEGARSIMVQAKTPEFIPNNPKKVKVQAVNSTTIYVEWRPPRNKDRNGIIRGYYVYCAQLDENNEPIPHTEETKDTNDGSKTEMVITGLKPDTMYQVTVAGYTRRGDGLRTRPKTISTKGHVPSEPRHLVAELIQPDPPIAQVTWSKPEFTNGQITGYKLYWGRKGEVYQQLSLNAQQQSYITQSLDRGAVYEFRVLASNEIDFGERAVIELVTPDGVPQGVPQHFSAVGLTENSVRLAWDLPAQKLRNGDIFMYQLVFHQLADANKGADVNFTVTQYDVINLDMNTDYVFQIRAYTLKGAGPWTTRLQYRTSGKRRPEHCIYPYGEAMNRSPKRVNYGAYIGSMSLQECKRRCVTTLLISCNSIYFKPSASDSHRFGYCYHSTHSPDSNNYFRDNTRKETRGQYVSYERLC